MKYIEEFIKNNKMKVIVMAILLFFSVAFLIFMKYNHFLYDDIIIRIISVNESRVEHDDISHVAPHYLQQIEARVMNGDQRGEIVSFVYERSYTSLFDYNFSRGNELFVDRLENLSAANILSVKRDFHIALLIVTFVFLLALVTSRRSFLILGAMIINIGIFVLVSFFRNEGINVFLLFSIATILFSIVTLSIICGFNKKTLAAIISTLVTVAVMMLIAYIVIDIGEIRFETMDFLPYFPDFNLIFFSGVLISGLGAIMDVTILMATAINELIYRDPQINPKTLKKSAWSVAQDNVGTSMNVLFYASIIGMTPLIIFFTVNGVGITSITRYWLSVEVIRALISSIGIVIAAPISYFVNLTIRRRWKI